MAVPVTLSNIEEYSLISIAVLGCSRHSQITVGNVTLPKAVLSTVKIFAVQVPYQHGAIAKTSELTLVHSHDFK